MTTVEDHLESYGANLDHHCPPVTPAELRSALRVEPPPDHLATQTETVVVVSEPRWRSLALVAALVITVLGSIAVARSVGNDPAAEEPPLAPATTAPPQPADTAVTSTTVSAARTGIPPIETGSLTETGLGPISWTVLDGDAGSLPLSISKGDDGWLYGSDGSGERWWRSTDGVDWQPTDPPPGGHDPIYQAGGYQWWVLSEEPGHQQLARRRSGSAPETVDLGHEPAEVPGLHRTERVRLVPVGEELLVFSEVGYFVDWIEHVEATPPPEGAGIDHPILLPELDENGTLRLIDPFGEGRARGLPVAATLSVITRESLVEFHDEETGRQVLSVDVGPLGVDAADAGRGLVTDGLWVSQPLRVAADGTLEQFPGWPAELTPVGPHVALDSGSTLLVARGPDDDSGPVIYRIDSELEIHPQPFPGADPGDWLSLSGDGVGVIATVMTAGRPTDSFLSSNGLDWQPIDVPADGGVQRWDAGWIGVLDNMEWAAIFLSSDGLEWEEVSVRKGSLVGSGQGTTGVVAIGRQIFLFEQTDGGRARLIVGELQLLGDDN
ncbi:MAG: hypothetical protein GY929_17260 [Actinomycetia bacterium]|nr:hypothetical protein [Actinomycetes bacterium]